MTIYEAPAPSTILHQHFKNGTEKPFINWCPDHHDNMVSEKKHVFDTKYAFQCYPIDASLGTCFGCEQGWPKPSVFTFAQYHGDRR